MLHVSKVDMSQKTLSYIFLRISEYRIELYIYAMATKNVSACARSAESDRGIGTCVLLILINFKLVLLSFVFLLIVLTTF